MTKLLEQAIEEVRKLSPKRQDELAEVLVSATSKISHTPEQIQAIDEGIADANAGRFATDEEITKIFGSLRAA